MMKRSILWNGLFLFGVLITATSCGRQQMPPTSENYPIMELTASDRTVYSNYSASIRGVQDVDIYPQVSGLISKVCISEGAAIKKGQILFVIDQVAYKAALQTAEANVENAKAAVATAQMTADSKRELYQEDIVSEYDLRTAQNTLSQQKAALAQAMAELTTAHNNLSYTEVKSPVDGIAGMIQFRTGALVSPSSALPLVSVSDNHEMYVYFSITEKQMLFLSRQNKLHTDLSDFMPEVELLLSDGTRYNQKGIIDAVSGVIDAKTGTVSVRAVFPNPDRILRSGGTGNIRIPYIKKECIVIPQESTYEIQNKIFVYKVVDGKTKSTPISVFPVNDGKEYIVETGLQVGDKIIATGAGMLRDGIKVTEK